jgi:hypothetical protein
MSHSYTSLAYRIVFATKHRQPIITKKIRKQLFEYMGNLVHRIGGDTSSRTVLWIMHTSFIFDVLVDEVHLFE